MIYLHYGNQSIAIVKSYILDKLFYLQEITNKPIRLIALISARKFFARRREIKKLYPNSIIIPHFPGLSYFNLNLILLIPIWAVLGSKKVIAKNIYAAALSRKLNAIGLIKTIIYDAEGAVYGERKEFGINARLSLGEIKRLEAQAVSSADLVRTVSSAMPSYWNDMLHIEVPKHVVIPCTLSEFYTTSFIDGEYREMLRDQLGYKKDNIVIIYAGSYSPWQGFDIMDKLLVRLLKQDIKIKVILLSDVSSEELKSAKRFPNQVDVKYVLPLQVKKYLSIADYGLLLRHSSITNRVAAPTKFAEYLACGLKVLISPDIGDYSAFTLTHGCGEVVSNPDELTSEMLTPRSTQERRKMHKLSVQHFTNEAYRPCFQQIIDL